MWMGDPNPQQIRSWTVGVSNHLSVFPTQACTCECIHAHPYTHRSVLGHYNLSTFDVLGSEFKGSFSLL